MEKAKKILLVFVCVCFFVTLFPIVSFATPEQTASSDPYPMVVPENIKFAYAELPEDAYRYMIVLNSEGFIYAITFNDDVNKANVYAHKGNTDSAFRFQSSGHEVYYKTYRFWENSWELLKSGFFYYATYNTGIPCDSVILYYCNFHVAGNQTLSHKSRVFEMSALSYSEYCSELIEYFGDNGGDNGGGNGGGQDYSGFFGSIIGKLSDIWNSIKNIPSAITELKDKVVNGFSNLLNGLLDGLDYLFNPNNERLDGSFSEAISDAFREKFSAFDDLQNAFNMGGWDGELVIDVPINFLGFSTNFKVDFSWYEPYRQQIRGALSVLLWVMCFLMNYRIVMSTLRLYVGGGAAGIYQANEQAHEIGEQRRIDFINYRLRGSNMRIDKD